MTTGIGEDIYMYPGDTGMGGFVSTTGQQVVGLGATNAVAFTVKPGSTAPPAVPSVVTGNRGSFAAVAAGNIDSDRVGIDKWFIASQAATVSPGHCVLASDLSVPAGVPGRLYNDLDCDN